MWTIPSKLDEDYIEKMEDILNTYEKPYNPMEPVLCLDEKSLQLLSDIRNPIPAKPGKIAKRDSEYKRQGTANAFCVVESLAGRHFAKITKYRKRSDYAKVIKFISDKYPKVKTIHLIQDNLNTHDSKSLIGTFGEKKGNEIWNRFTVHYTPKHASWLNMAEIEIGIYSGQCIGKRRIADIKILKEETKAWNKYMNRTKQKINWKFTTKDARKKFKYERI